MGALTVEEIGSHAEKGSKGEGHYVWREAELEKRESANHGGSSGEQARAWQPRFGQWKPIRNICQPHLGKIPGLRAKSWRLFQLSLSQQASWLCKTTGQKNDVLVSCWGSARLRDRTLQLMEKRRWDHFYIFSQGEKTEVEWLQGLIEWPCVLVFPVESQFMPVVPSVIMNGISFHS